MSGRTAVVAGVGPPQGLGAAIARRFASQRAALLAKFRPGYLAPVIGLMKGLTDPMVGLLMGQTAENLAHRFGIKHVTLQVERAESDCRGCD